MTKKKRRYRGKYAVYNRSGSGAKWGVITRRVQMFDNEERIKGAYRFGKLWRMLSDAILLNAHKKSEEPTLPMSRESPFLEMTNLYPTAGKADECVCFIYPNRR